MTDEKTWKVSHLVSMGIVVAVLMFGLVGVMGRGDRLMSSSTTVYSTPDIAAAKS